MTFSTAQAALEQAKAALKGGRYTEAITQLQEICLTADIQSSEYVQACIWTAKAHQKNGDLRDAEKIYRELADHPNPEAREWSRKALATLETSSARASLSQSDPSRLRLELDATEGSDGDALNSVSASAPSTSRISRQAQSDRSAVAMPLAKSKLPERGIRGTALKITAMAGNLALASGVTLSLFVGMVFVLAISLAWVQSGQSGITFPLVAIALTIAVNALMFFISPLLMDLTQRWLYQTDWMSLEDLRLSSPESAQVVEQVCRKHGLKIPRLGIIPDRNPTAFTYGTTPNSARVVVSQGLFEYLDDDEAAAVYAHELGHVVHWDFAVMTLASTLIQIVYLLYVFASNLKHRTRGKNKDAVANLAIVAYIFYVVGSYLLMYLSRVREYYADHFAAETTGNPNGLSRALVKIAYGILEVSQTEEKPSKLLQGTRAMGIFDPKTASATGTVQAISSEAGQIGRVFLWDLFNPWAWWMELNSTHPLTGKRVRALSTYAEQLGLRVEFDMGRVVAEGNTLNRQRLYGTFVTDVFLMHAHWIGTLLGLAIGAGLLATGTFSPAIVVAFALLGFGAGILFRTNISYPTFKRAAAKTVLDLMSDPYASPFRGQPVQLTGEVIGRGNAGYRFGSDLKMQDSTGLIFLRYSSRFGPLGNFLFGSTQAAKLIGRRANSFGWFRRGIAPWMDLALVSTEDGQLVSSYFRFWQWILASLSLVAGVVLGVTAIGAA